VTGQRDRWAELTGGQSGEEYAQRFAQLAASGHDIHGEATFCTALLKPAARVLDAGCGTGRIAIRLAELGHPPRAGIRGGSVLGANPFAVEGRGLSANAGA
jgi:2-polyprenyl-3-methyl-5-hydroxy-6-metoxy-1,4-benzoquinol methylase